MNEMRDQDQCDCGSVEFICVTCPETMKYIDVCKNCGDAGSHLCDHIDCPCNEALKARLVDEEATAAGEARYRESVLRDEI